MNIRRDPSDNIALSSHVATVKYPIASVSIRWTAANDAQFLEWERKHRAAVSWSNERGIGDDETDRRTDAAFEIEMLISRTPAAALVSARVKAALPANNMRVLMLGEERDQLAVRTLPRLGSGVRIASPAPNSRETEGG